MNTKAQDNQLMNILKKEPYHFDPKACRSANVSVLEAKFMRWVYLKEQSNLDVIQYFGLGFAYNLLKQGYVENPLGQQDSTETNIWKISNDGIAKLKEIVGDRS
jgi:hypothetical protein